MTTVSNAQVLIQLSPISLIFFGIFYFKEKPTIIQWMGILTAIGGFGVFFLDQFSLVVSQKDKYLTGNLWIVFASLTWVAFAVWQKILSRSWTPQQINLLVYGVSALALSFQADFTELAHWDSFIWILMCILGLNTLIAYGALGIALNSIPASQVSVIISVNPLLTLVLVKLIDVFTLNWIASEPMHAMGYVGAGLVVSGVVLSVYKRSS